MQMLNVFIPAIIYGLEYVIISGIFKVVKSGYSVLHWLMTNYTEIFYIDLFHYSSSVLNGFYVFLIGIFIHQFIKFSRVFHSHLDKPTCS